MGRKQYSYKRKHHRSHRGGFNKFVLSCISILMASILIALMIYIDKLEETKSAELKAFADKINREAQDNEAIEKLTKKNNNEVKEDNLISIVCWGDSLTAGAGASNEITINGLTGATMPTTLAHLTGKTVYNMGVGGEDSRTIACRQGGLSMMVNNIIIPASGSVTFERIVSEDGNEIYPCRQDWQGQRDSFDNCTIGGIAGALTYDDETKLYTFTRINDGIELTINTDTEIITSPSRDRRDDILILEIGHNGGWNEDYEVLISQYNSMIEHNNRKEYIIVGDTDGTAESKEEWEKALEGAFGEHFVNMREYLSENGLRDCGLTPTADDKNKIESGEVPLSLKSDATHLNSYGYWSKGNAIYIKGVELGYWN